MQAQDVVLELDEQVLLGRTGEVGLQGQAIGAFMDVDRRIVGGLRLGAGLGRRGGRRPAPAGWAPTVTRIEGPLIFIVKAPF